MGPSSHQISPPPNTSLDAYLCHSPDSVFGYCTYDENGKKLFSTEIEKILHFLDQPKNAHAVVTLFLEDRVGQELIQKTFDKLPALKGKVFNFDDYKDTNEWPTLQEIIDSQKRLIIFVEQENGNYILGNGTNTETILVPEDQDFMVQNTYDLKSPLIDNWACESRWPHIPLNTKKVNHANFTQWSRLFTLNQFHAFLSTTAHAAQIDNNLTWLENRVDSACAQANDGVRLVPNYIALDDFKVGDAFAYAAALTEGGVYFYENDDGVSEGHPTPTPNTANAHDVVCVVPTSHDWELKFKAYSCENDEARSLALRGVKKGISIKLFDSPKASKSDDYTTIEVLRDIGLDERIVLNDLEDTSSNSDVKITHKHKNGLKGKISYLIIEPTTGSTEPKIRFTNNDGGFSCTVPADVDALFEANGSAGSNSCKNDDIAGFTLTRASAGTTITLYGDKNSDENCKQGCVKIFVRKDMTEPVTIENIDKMSSHTHSSEEVLIKRYGGMQQLYGKISYIQVSTGVEDFNNENVIPTSSEADGAFGAWGPKAICPVGKFAWGFQLKFEKDGGKDHTALNSIKMFCGEDGESVPIESKVGDWGEYGKIFKCPSSIGPIKGFQLRTRLPINANDEIMATDISGICQDNNAIGGEFENEDPLWGAWGNKFYCPEGTQVVGFKTRVEDYVGDNDDTAMNGLRMYCDRTLGIPLPIEPIIEQLTPDTSILYWDDSKVEDGLAEFEIKDGDGNILLTTKTNFTEFKTSGISKISVTAVDSDGNRSPTVTAAVPKYDDTPPVTPTGLRVNNLQGGLIEIIWDKSAAPADSLSYEVSIDDKVTGNTSDTSMTLKDPDAPVNFTISIKAHKFNGTTSPAASLLIDRTPPSKPETFIFNELKPTSLTLTWAQSTDDIKMKDYAVYQDNILLDHTSGTTFNVSHLTPETNYTFTVKSIDTTDNYSEAKSVFVDRESPTEPTALKYAKATDTSVDLSWNSSSDNVGATGYKIDRDDAATFDTKTLNFTDTTLKPVTTYRYEVRAYDDNLNISQPGTLLLDRVPPSAPTNLSHDKDSDTGTALQLKWTASTDDIGVTGYNIYQDDNPTTINTGTSTSATVNKLSPDTTYTFYIEAFDEAGNKSERTSILVDRVRPIIDPFFWAHSPYGTNDEPPSLSWSDATDDIAVTGYELSLDGKVIHTAASAPFSTIGLDLDATTNHTFTLRAYDAANNYSTPKDLVLYHNRPNMPKDIKGVYTSSATVVDFSWFPGDNNTVNYSLLTNNGVDHEQAELTIRSTFNESLEPPSVTIKVEAINAEGAKSLSVFCKRYYLSTGFGSCDR